MAGVEGRQRGNKRRAAGHAKLTQAVAAVVGGLLQAWAKGDAVFRSRTPADFTGGNVAARQYITAIDALTALGFVRISRSIRYPPAAAFFPEDVNRR